MPNVVLVSHGRKYTQIYDTTGKYMTQLENMTGSLRLV